MKSGYQNKQDGMRSEAEKALSAGLRGVNAKEKMSKSEADNSKPRLFKKGGPVHGKSCEKMGKVKKMSFGGVLKDGDFLNRTTRSPGIVKPTSPIPGAVYKKGGEVKKMAIGGVGKIRKGEATKSGKPIKQKRKKMSELY